MIKVGPIHLNRLDYCCNHFSKWSKWIRCVHAEKISDKIDIFQDVGKSKFAWGIYGNYYTECLKMLQSNLANGFGTPSGEKNSATPVLLIEYFLPKSNFLLFWEKTALWGYLPSKSHVFGGFRRDLESSLSFSSLPFEFISVSHILRSRSTIVFG